MEFQKAGKGIFIITFFILLLLPLVTMFFHNSQISKSENRKLAPKAKLVDEEGKINQNFTRDFESWIDDHIGLRDRMVAFNAQIQYRLFNRLEKGIDMYLGPNGELNYATSAIIGDYQRKNLYDEDYLRGFASSMQALSDYAKSKGASFYYYQCWDKHSIYPEYFPKTVIAGEGLSKTDGMIRALQEYTDVSFISSKEKLVEIKNQYETYTVWGDPTHWSRRGAYIGYLDLMRVINQRSKKKYMVLQEEDYNLTLRDLGYTVSGCIHEISYEECFDLLKPKAVQDNDRLTLYSGDYRHCYYVNDAVDNNTRILIIGDSYFKTFIVDDLAESFHETVLIWGDYLSDYKAIVDEYNPDIVIVEAAERVDRSYEIMAGAAVLK